MKIKDGFKLRLRIVFFLIFLFGAVLITRLFFVQVIKNDYYKNLANQQYIAPAAKNFDRGYIYFKDKTGQLISAAAVKNGFQIVINPQKIKEPEKIYQAIVKLISLDKDDFFMRAGKTKDTYEVIAHRIEGETTKKISDLKLEGVSVFSESWRYYPAGNLGSRLLGFVGYKGDSVEGRYGLEQYYEKILSRNDENVFINSFAEIFTDIKKTISDSGDSEKGDIVLTIEPNIQSFLEKTLEKTAEKYKSEMIGGIIIEPKTGKITAMAVKPDFNPNSYAEVKNLSVFMNPIVDSVFEMGSIMKPLTVAAALNEGKITSETSYIDKGYVIIDGEKIENLDGKSRGKSTIQDVLNYSINTGAIFTMEQLGKEKFGEYLKNYGLGERTGIDLPEEVKGKISNVMESPREIEYATASFGQGIAVSPIEMAVALSSLANGGYLMRPFVVEEIKLKGEKDKKIEPQTMKQVLKNETSEEISRMLSKVFDEGLMGGMYKMEHYSIAAKTGTAQVVKTDGRGYEENSYIHTFFGYAPAFDARFLTFLFLKNPQGVRLSSHSLSEPFVNITKFLLNYYEIQPDR